MNNFLNIINCINNSKNIMLVCHKNPDGDAFGSTLAMYKALTNIGKTVDIYCEKPYNKKIMFLPNAEMFNAERKCSKYDLAISLDCADYNRLGEFAGIFDKVANTICIDHHASNKGYAKYNFINSKSSATCEYLFDILSTLNEEIPCFDDEVATCLYSGIITDSGDFRNNNTTMYTKEVANKIESTYKIDSSRIISHFMDEIDMNIFLLKTRVLSKARFNEEKTVGLIYFSQKDFKETNTDLTCTEGIINDIKNITGIRVAAAVTQVSEEVYKISLRSAREYPIAMLAIQKGGGGHENAAGYQENGYELDVLDTVMRDCENYAQ